MLNKNFIVYLCKFFGGKIIYLSDSRFCHSTSALDSRRYTDILIKYKKKIQLFNFFIFFNKDNFYYKYIKNLSSVDNKNIIHIGLPNMYSTWKYFIQKTAIKVKEDLISKYKFHTFIYTIIGSKDGDAQHLKSKKSLYNCLLKIINNLCLNDPKCLILFKCHPRQPIPIYLKKVLKKIKSKKIIRTSVNVDILALISKRFFFTSPTGILTHTQNVKKIDFSDYRKKFINIAEGYGVLYINPKNPHNFNKLKKYFSNDSFFKNKKVYSNEINLIKENYPRINSLIEILKKLILFYYRIFNFSRKSFK